jgi:hypothetical protein
MRYLEELYRAAAQATAEAAPISGDMHNPKAEPDEYIIQAETVARLQLALKPALVSLSKLRRESTGFDATRG